MHQTHSIKELLASFLEASPFQRQLTSARLRTVWQEAMPKAVCERTEKLYVHKGKIVLKLTSAALRQELHCSKDKILTLFQEAMPNSVFQEVVLL